MTKRIHGRSRPGRIRGAPLTDAEEGEKKRRDRGGDPGSPERGEFIGEEFLHDMYTKKRVINLIIGPALFILISTCCTGALTVPGAKATGVAAWMIYWWVTAPIGLTATAILPIITNAFLQQVPQANVISQYACENILLIAGSTMLTAPWATIGLDRRIALKALSIIGPSMKSQVIVWTVVTTALSTVLPNIVVVSLLCPIAVAMIKAAGFDDIKTSEPGQIILLAIAYAVSVGGMGTPMGGAMNVTSISALQDYLGIEFMYIDWIKRVIPFLILLTILGIAMVMFMPMKIKRLEGTREFFQEQYAALGPVKKSEVFSLSMFILALVGSLTRTWWSGLLPGLVPAYLFITLGFIGFFVGFKGLGFALTWERTQAAMPWGSMILFASGLALGQMLTGSGASEAMGQLMMQFNLDGGLTTIIILVVFSRLISEVTNGTTAAALTCPIIFAFTAELGVNPIPYWFINIMAYNAEYMLPLSVRTVNVAYGMSPQLLMKNGWWQCIINMVATVIIGYLSMQFWPGFGDLVNYTWTG